MNVRELSRDELDELKTDFVYKILESPSYDVLAVASEIPDEIIFEYYDGIDFVKDDFFCNVEDRQ